VISVVVEHDKTSSVEVQLAQDSFALSVALELLSLDYYTEQSCNNNCLICKAPFGHNFRVAGGIADRFSYM